MRRIRMLLLAGAVATAASCVAIASAQASATVELRTTSVGPILVNESGFTLYEFSLDKRKHDNCLGIAGCYETWKPLLAPGPVTAGPGLKAKKVSTIGLYYGRQVTYSGHALYTYTGDTAPGQTAGVGAFQFGGFWFAVNAKGKKVT
jgi:predicted lipoprotein with Yx(FWY)xxD motif